MLSCCFFNGREIFGRALVKDWGTLGRNLASAGRDPPLPTGIDLACPTRPGLLTNHIPKSPSACFGASAHSKPQGPRGSTTMAMAPQGLRLPWGRAPCPPSSPAGQSTQAPPSSKGLQAACGPRALHQCHKESKEGADSVPLLPRPCLGRGTSLLRVRAGEDSEEPAARPGLLPCSQAGLKQARGLWLFARPKNCSAAPMQPLCSSPCS